MRDLIAAVKISVEDNIHADIGGVKCPSEGRRHEPTTIQKMTKTQIKIGKQKQHGYRK